VAKPSPRSANPVDEHVGSRIRLRRQVVGLSQEKLGESLGVTFQQVQKYERGTNRVGASRLYDLSRVLEVPVNFFYEGLGDDANMAFGDNDQRPLVYDFIKSSEGVQLALAMSQIEDRTLRRQLVDLARAIAKSQAKAAARRK
jgi:transcriptional regulator with XRE-family HTH domain